MARANTQTEVYKNITEIAMYDVAAANGDTTVPGALAAGASTVTVASGTNFAADEPIFIIGTGGFERNEVDSVATNTITLKYKLAIDQDAGARLVSASKTILGYPTRDGLSFTGSLQNTPIESAIASLPIGYIAGNAELSLNFALLGWNIENLQLMFGAPESVTGAGTEADPYQGAVLAETVATAGLRAIVVTGTLRDLKNFTIDFLNFQHEISGNVQMGKDVASYPVSGKCTGLVKRLWT